MNKLARKVALTVLTSLLAVSLTAGLAAAVDKLIVQDGSANTVFKVDDTGVTQGTFGLDVFSGADPNDYAYMNAEAYSDTFWKGGFIVAKRARGTSAARTAVIENDYIFTFDAQAHDGTDWARAGQIVGYVDGPVSAGIVPMRWSFATTDTTGATVERFLVRNAGEVEIKNMAGSYAGGSAYVCVNNSGQLFASESPCP